MERISSVWAELQKANRWDTIWFQVYLVRLVLLILVYLVKLVLLTLVLLVWNYS